MSESWDILWQVELGCEVFPRLNRIEAFMGSGFYLFSCLPFLLTAGQGGKPNDSELEDPENLQALCQERGSGGWNRCLNFLAAEGESNNMPQESFEGKLDCGWKILQEYTVWGPELLSEHYLYHIIKFPLVGGSARLWRPALLKCWWLVVISSYQWDCYVIHERASPLSDLLWLKQWCSVPLEWQHPSESRSLLSFSQTLQQQA